MPEMPKFKIEILYDTSTGQVAVSAPTQVLLVCYAMLEMAKDICRQQANAQITAEAEKRVELVGGVNLPNLKV